MKKRTIWLMALLLLLVGCRPEGHPENLSVADALCPYEVRHGAEGVYIAIDDGAVEEVRWDAELLPEGLCALSAEAAETGSKWLLSAREAGLSQLTLSALDGEDTLRFQLTVMLETDQAGGITAQWAEHKEHRSGTGATGELPWSWETDIEGVLSFKLRDRESYDWQLTSEPTGVCQVSELMLLPSGCGFEVRALEPGTAELTLENPEQKRTLRLRFRVDEAYQLQLLSVEE